MQLITCLLGLAAVASAQSSSGAVSSGAASASMSGSASASASSSAPSASASSGQFMQALMSNSYTSTLATLLANTNPALGISDALNSPDRNLTLLAPPAAALQALASNALVGSVSVNVSYQGSNTSVSLVDALLAYHIINGSYPASAIASALSSSSTGLTLGTLLSGAYVDVFAVLGGTSTTPMQASASASGSSAAPSASASSAPASSSSFIFVNNALVTTANAIQVGDTSSAPGVKVVHFISNALDPFFPLVGVAEPPSQGMVIEPTVVAQASTLSASIVPFSLGSSAAASGSGSGSGAASATPAPSASGSAANSAVVGPMTPTAMASSTSATMRLARWL